MMPRMNGPNLARRLVAMRPDLRLLFMSGYTESQGELRVELDPGVAFLSKPFTPDALLLKVREVLDRTGAPQQLTSA
jgi:CheY-like chemotaxis protein